MSAKSSAQPTGHSQHFFTRKIILLTIAFVTIMFFMTVSYYPLIFSPERSTTTAPTSPATDIR